MDDGTLLWATLVAVGGCGVGSWGPTGGTGASAPILTTALGWGTGQESGA